MRYLSVCSGIEAATCAWHHMGWKPEAFSEIEPFPSAVLAHHYPDTPNLGDMTKYKEWNLGAIDLLVGGTPCQSFSVAGLRKGMADPRGNLALVYLGIADLFKPKWVVWENVPGVLSSNGGRDFGSFLGALAQLGYGFAYRVLDAQWFGVAQRRKRVFVVGYLGDWRPAAAVLFERESLRRDTAPSREKGEKPTGTIGSRTSSGGGFSTDFECAGGLQPIIGALTAKGPCAMGAPEVDGGHYLPISAIPLNSMTMQGRPSDQGRMGSGIGQPGDPCPTITKAHSHAVAQPISIQGNLIGREAGGPQGVDASDEGVMYTLTKADVHGVAQPIAFHATQDPVHGSVSPALGSNMYAGVMQPVGAFKSGQGAQSRSIGWDENVSPTLPSNAGGNTTPALLSGMAVRRLTPRECERLQGFRDDYTLIPWRGKEAPDGPRYKALGNSMAVPVMRWIGERIESLS